MIKISGKEFPFRFALKAQRELSSLEDTSKVDDVYLIYLGLKYGALDEGLKWEYTEDEILDLLEKDMDAFEKCCELLGRDMASLKKKRAKAMNVLLE